MNKPFVKATAGGRIGGCIRGGGSDGDTANSSDFPPRPLALSSPPEPIVRTGYGGDDGSDNDVNSNEERKQDDCGGGLLLGRDLDRSRYIINRNDELLQVDVDQRKELQVIPPPSTTTKGAFVSRQSGKSYNDTGIKDESDKVSSCMKSHPSDDDDDDWTKTKKIINRQTNNRKMMAMMTMMQNNHQVSSSLTSSSSSLLSPSSTEHYYSSTDTDTTSNATFGTSHQSSGITMSSAVDIAVQTKHEEDDDYAVVDVAATGADGAAAGNNESDDLPQDEIIALAPLPPLSGTKRRHRPATYRSSSDGLASQSSPPPFSPSSSYGITNPHRRYHRRNSILRHLDGFGTVGGGSSGSQDDMLMAAMIAAREVSGKSQYQHGSVLNNKHRRTNSSDVVLTGTPPSLSHRFSFSRNHHANYPHPIVSSSSHALQAEDMVTRPPTSPTMMRRTMMIPPPPPFTSSTTEDCPSYKGTSTSAKVTVSSTGKESEPSCSRADSNQDEAGARDQLEQPSVDSDGVAMEISDHLRNMGIIDGKDEGDCEEEEEAGGDEEDRNGSNNTTTQRRNFYSSWSDSDDTNWYMEMDENGQTNNAR